MRFLLAGIVLIVLGCATTLNTASGKPEVMINARMSQVREAITDGMLNKGYAIKSSGEGFITYSKSAPASAQIMTGYGSRVQVNYTLNENSAGIRIMGTITLVSMDGREYDMTEGKTARDLQIFLEKLSKTFTPPLE